MIEEDLLDQYLYVIEIYKHIKASYVIFYHEGT